MLFRTASITCSQSLLPLMLSLSPCLSLCCSAPACTLVYMDMRFCFLICVFICVCTSTCHTHVVIRGQPQVSVLMPFPPFVWVTFSLNLKLPHIRQPSWPPNFQEPPISAITSLLLKSQAHAPHGFRWVLEIQTQVLMVVKQTLYQLLHLPSPWTITITYLWDAPLWGLQGNFS